MDAMSQFLVYPVQWLCCAEERNETLKNYHIIRIRNLTENQLKSDDRRERKKEGPPF